MKKINLDIKIDDLKPEKDFKDKTGIKISENFIISAFNYIQSTPKNHGDPNSAGLNVAEQRKVNKVVTAIENHQDSIVELEDDMYEYLKTCFNKVQWIGGTKIVVRVADAIDNVIKEETEAEVPADA